MEKNFFGIGLGDSFYDKRRHINIIFSIFTHYRLFAEGQSFAAALAPIIHIQDEDYLFYCFTQGILAPLEVSYLNYLKNRYNLPEEDFKTILSGYTLREKDIKSPAGYYIDDNWKLIIHMYYATLCVEPEYHKVDYQIQTSMILPFANGMRGINLDQNNYNTIVMGINDCINRGLTQFNDLPKIENYIISRL